MVIAVVIPSYKVKKHIEAVVNSVPDFVNYIIVVDDKCPQISGNLIESLNLSRVTVVFHRKNKGVGGAVVSGYKKALKLGADIVVKMDGDGQMNPKYMEDLIQPILDNKADYTKGNRFKNFQELKSMPKIRLFGNSVLSFLIKFSSGYWNIMDPTNGYTAITRKALEDLSLDNISKRYFFESDMLVNLNIENKVVHDVAIPAQYADEESSLKISKEFVNFLLKIPLSTLKRIFYKYYIFDFNMVSIYLLLGFPMILFGGVFGMFKWYEGVVIDSATTTGGVMLSVLPIILGVQFLLQAVKIDMENVPKK